MVRRIALCPYTLYTGSGGVSQITCLLSDDDETGILTYFPVEISLILLRRIMFSYFMENSLSTIQHTEVRWMNDCAIRSDRQTARRTKLTTYLLS